MEVMRRNRVGGSNGAGLLWPSSPQVNAGLREKFLLARSLCVSSLLAHLVPTCSSCIFGLILLSLLHILHRSSYLLRSATIMYRPLCRHLFSVVTLLCSQIIAPSHSLYMTFACIIPYLLWTVSVFPVHVSFIQRHDDVNLDPCRYSVLGTLHHER